MSNLLQNKDLELNDFPPLYAVRKSAADIFANIGIPSKKEENWKYTGLRALERDDFVVPDHECHHDHCHEHHSILPFEAYEINFCNGHVCHLPHELPKGVFICSLMEAYTDYEAKKKLNKHIDLNKNPFCALNTAYLQNGLYIEIAKGTQIEKPIAFCYKTKTEGKNLLLNIHNLIVAKQDSNAKILECFYYEGEQKSEYFLNVVNEIFLEKNALLTHCKVQNDAFYANHIAYNSVVQKEGSSYNGFCLQKGANIGRNETRAELIEPNAKFILNGAYKMNGWALLDTTSDIRHLSPDTYSKQIVRGVVGGKAHGVFQGRIHIAEGSDNTEGSQQHKAILLSDEAEIDCKPELEIFADDVKCSHGATCGELDKEMLFYMMSRGISKGEAEKMLIEAYLLETFENIEDAKIKDWLRDEL